MRELVFAVAYEEGADPIMDAFRAYPDLRSRSVACHVSSEGVWRIDRFTGPAEALDRVESVFGTHDRCLDCVAGVHDGRSTHYEVLSADANVRTVYSFREARTGCFSLPCLTCKHVPKGILSESRRRGDTEEWRLLMREDEGVGALFEDLQATLRPGLSAEFSKLSDVSYWSDRSVTVAELPYEQRAAVEAAVARGYYRTPRDVSLGELAAELDVPRSTLQYRLQRAEGWIVRQFVRNSTLGDVAGILRDRDTDTYAVGATAGD